MDAPKTTIGNVVASSIVLAIGAGVGAAAGYYASPPPAVNQQLGAVEGGVLGGLLTAFAGLVFSSVDEKWRKLGETTAIIGVGGIAAMALLGVATSAPKVSASPQTSSVVTANQPLTA